MLLAVVLAAASAATCQPEAWRRAGPAFGRDAAAFVPKGWRQEAFSQPDLNRDGQVDRVLVIREAAEGAEGRRLIAAVATPQGFRNVGEAQLFGHPLGQAHLEFSTRGVLSVTDLTGGTTANQTVYRYRYEGADALQGAMRYIGLEIGHYSRTNRHDAMELSFNWLTGEWTRRIDKLTHRGDYAPGRTDRGRNEAPCWFMENTEDPENYVAAEYAD